MLKSVLRRIRKGVRDIGSGIGDFAKDNPLITLGAAAFGLPALFGSTPTAFLGGAADFLLGDKANPVTNRLRKKAGLDVLGREGGFLEKLMPGGIKDLIPLITAKMAKDQFEKEAEEIRRLREEQQNRYDEVSNYIGSRTGGSPFAKDMFTGYTPIEYDPETGRATNYPYADRSPETSKDGGIAKLKMGGMGGSGPMPFNPNNKISGMIPAMAMGGETTGVPGLSADMSNKQMMNKIEDTPGITAFFPRRLGMINGPGGPKEDKIPAMLSDGEFVFTAKAVENAGGPKAMYNMMNKLDPESSKGKGII
jgi:hypothetical protein